jgi:hypothetical protein
VKRIRRKLSFSNAVALLALFVALGGSAYAATQLPKNSVGSKQIKEGAVSPAKLSRASKSTLTGATGPQGPAGKEGAAGKEGPPGKEGPQGPGAVSFEDAATPAERMVRSVDGIELIDSCNAEAASIKFVGAGGIYLSFYGTHNLGSTVYPIASDSTSVSYNGANVGVDMVVRSSGGNRAFTRFDLHIFAGDCKLVGMITPSSAG